MRKLGLIILIIAALILVAALALPRFLDVNRYHGRIQAELEKLLNRTVSLGKMRLSILPLAFRVENAVIGDDPAFPGGRPFAQAEELYVTAALMPLLHGDIQVQSLDLRKPRIELVRNQEGVWNFASLGRKAAAPSAPAPTGAQPSPEQQAQKPVPEPAREFSLSSLRIRDGQVALTDLQERQARAVYDHIDLELKDYAPGRPFSIAVAAHLPGKEAQTLELDGRAGPISDSLVITPFEAKLKLNQVSLSSLQRFLNIEALASTDAVASGEAEVKNESGKLASRGSLKLEQARLRGVEIGYPITADYNLSHDLNGGVLRIEKGALKLGAAPVSITGAVNTRPTPSQLDLKVSAANISIQEAARLAAALGVAFNPGMKIEGRLTADIQAQGAATKPALNGSLAAQDLSITGKDLAQPVKVKGIELALSPQAIRSNNFSATTGSTTLSVQFTLSEYTARAPNVDLAVRTADANVGELLNIAKAYGVAAAEGMSGTGAMSLDVHAAGPVKDYAAMTYSGNGLLQNASLHLPQLTRPLQVRNANLRFTQSSVVAENLVGSLGETNATGRLTLRNFSAPQVQFTLSADKLNVAEWQQVFSGGTPARSSASSARWNLVPRAEAAAATESLFSRTTGSGTLTAASVIYDQLVLTNVRSSVTLDRGVMRFAPLTGELYGGQTSGSVVIDTRPTPTTYTISTKLDRVDANKLLSAVSTLQETLYGLLATNANTTFTSAPPGQAVRTLNGKLSLDLKNGKLANVDLLYELASIGKFLALGRKMQPFTDIVQMTGNFDVRNGVAQTDNLKAIIDGGTVAAAGAVDLAGQSLQMRLTAVLSKAMSAEVGGTGIGGFMTTALANEKGELVIPVLVTGTFQKPKFAPDFQRIAEVKLRNLLPTASNPGELTSTILGAIVGKKGDTGGQGQPSQQGDQPPKQQQPSSPWTEILDSVLGQKKQQQQPQPPPQPPQQKQQQQDQPPEQPK